MNPEDFLRIENLPELREPVLLAAFEGWNDASEVATFALGSLKETWSAESFAEVDPEEFYAFTETRPTISLEPGGQRSLEWPSNTFFAHSLDDRDRDVVLLIGTEPELKWRTFCRVVLHLANQLNASCLITLGGFLADVPHTVEPRLTGHVTSPDLLPRLRDLNVHLSSYEGPTGIVGALHDAWVQTSKPAIGLWGNVPHYISATPNPQVALALLRGLAALLTIELPLGALELRATAFRTQIDEALMSNPEAKEYVQQLEEHFASGAPPTPEPELIEELEDFLRMRRPPGEDQPG